MGFRVFGHNGAALTNDTPDRPADSRWRLNRVWAMEGTESVSGELCFDCSSITGLVDRFECLRLLVDSDGVFADATAFTGIYTANTYRVAGLPLYDSGYYYTLAAYPLAMTTYVSQDSTTPVWPYTNWVTAATDIQTAVEIVEDGGTVWVSNGVYATGVGIVSNMPNRVALTRPVTVCSVNGPEVTVIEGQGPIGANAVRCAYLTEGAVLAGFTLRNGFTRTTGEWEMERCGGGVLLYHGGVVSNCIIRGSSADRTGGGAYGFGPDADAYYGTLYNCLLIGNSAAYSGGSRGGTLYNCTISGNSAGDYGSGAYKGTLYNCIVHDNTGDPNHRDCVMAYSCTTPDPGGTGNVTKGPMFIDASAGNYRLQAGSPCADAGTNQAWMVAATDLGGRPRIIGPKVDIGAYELGAAIEAVSGAHGAINPFGTVWVAYGSDQAFSITPERFYHITDVATNGASVGAVRNFTWGNVTTDGTIHATFAADCAACGTPHWWLAQSGLTNDGCSFNQAETNNPDGDPFTTAEEYICDTDPTNAASYFRIMDIPELSPVTIDFISSPNRVYTLQVTSNLLSGVWTNVPGAGPRMGAGDWDYMQDTNTPAAGLFYRLEVGFPQ